jgi:estrogen-related receptor beta like 1
MDDDDDDQPLAQQSRRESKKDGSATNVAMGPIYLMWENALEKLKILNYEESFCALQSRKPFNRVYFAMPSTNASHQFDDFIEICAWLCGEITHNQEFFQKDQFDDPNTVANKLMLALRQLEFRLSFPSQKLKTAHGEHVCSVLEFLTDSALQAKGFKWGTPVYMEADEVSEL